MARHLLMVGLIAFAWGEDAARAEQIDLRCRSRITFTVEGTKGQDDEDKIFHIDTRKKLVRMDAARRQLPADITEDVIRFDEPPGGVCRVIRERIIDRRTGTVSHLVKPTDQTMDCEMFFSGKGECVPVDRAEHAPNSRK